MRIFSSSFFATAAVVIVWAPSLSFASVHTARAQFTKGKKVATSYMTLQSYSDIKCVRKCFVEKKQNRCSIAGYDKTTQTCFLSNDGQQDLLDADEEFGVFLYSDTEGMFIFNLHNCIAMEQDMYKHVVNYLLCDVYSSGLFKYLITTFREKSMYFFMP